MSNYNEYSDYYDLLEIGPEAGPREIEHAYRKSLNLYADESNAIYSIISVNECEEMRQKIEEAYLVLSSQEKRKLYNEAKGIEAEQKTEEASQTSKLQRSSEELSRKLSNYPENSYVEKGARSKYLLDYKIDPQFEQEIESSSDFSGSFLQKIRMYKGVNIQRLSELTRIMPAYLVYLEEENFKKLPATAYVRGFVFQYAKYLKLNSDLVSSSYIRRVKEARNEVF